MAGQVEECCKKEIFTESEIRGIEGALGKDSAKAVISVLENVLKEKIRKYGLKPVPHDETPKFGIFTYEEIKAIEAALGEEKAAPLIRAWEAAYNRWRKV